jgi:hypothetical protein
VPVTGIFQDNEEDIVIKRKYILGLIITCLFCVITAPSVLSQEKGDEILWEEGHVTATGEDSITIDDKKYDVSPEVAITGINGDSKGYEPNKFRLVDKIQYRLLNETIIEIRIVRLTS